MWAMHPTPSLNPAGSFLKMVSIAPLSLISMILQKILLGTEKSVTPRQFILYCVLLGEFNNQTPAPVFRCGLGILEFME